MFHAIGKVASRCTRSSSANVGSVRYLGALTQKSWGQGGTTASSTENGKTSVDAMMESIFSRRLVVSHQSRQLPPLYDNLEQVMMIIPFEEPVTEEASDVEPLQALNRNARKPKKANKGARPCSRASRRKKKEKFGKRKRSF